MGDDNTNWDKKVGLEADLRDVVNVGLAFDDRHAAVGHYSDRHLFASNIFSKLLAHGMTLLSLLRTDAGSLWDLSSSCAVGRCLIEALDSLCYFALDEVPNEERHFRQRLGFLHDQERRANMLALIRSEHAEFERIKRGLPALRTEILAHPHASTLGRDFKKKVIQGDAPLYHLSQRGRNLQHGLDHSQFQVATMYLSQFVHTTPFAMSQLQGFRAGTKEALDQMLSVIQHSLPYAAVAVERMLHLYEDELASVAPKSVGLIAFWSGVAKVGVSRAAPPEVP